jgi:hypothetical protein
VLVVTPVIFFWLRERELRKGRGAQPPIATGEDAAASVKGGANSEAERGGVADEEELVRG